MTTLTSRLKLALAPVLLAAGLAAAATPASATVTLVAGQESCDLYSATGCKFSWSGGASFDDPLQIVAAYNAIHNPTPSPQDLPTLSLLGKVDDGQSNGAVKYTDTGNVWTFATLPFNANFYTVKTGSSYFLLFGVPAGATSLTAKNLVIKNGQSQNYGDISHMTFFSAPSPTGAVPEPVTWAMMIGGFFATGAMLRRRQLALAA